MTQERREAHTMPSTQGKQNSSVVSPETESSKGDVQGLGSSPLLI